MARSDPRVTERPADDRLHAFEEQVCSALRAKEESWLEILGYGEVTTVFAVDDRWACKRMPAFSSRPDAEACAAVIHRYVEALTAAGVDVLETYARVIEGTGATWVVYCVQPRLESTQLGPVRMRALPLDAALRDLDRILDAMQRSVSPRLAPDGQLSNWAFAGDRMFYLDVTSPFLRDENGRDVLDWSQYLRSLPGPLRPVARRWVVPHLLDKYFTLRGQVVDLLGNLKKERLEHLEQPFRMHINARWKLEPLVTQAEVEKYYVSDARTYAFLQAARRVDRWLQRDLLGREYPYVLPPPLDRNL